MLKMDEEMRASKSCYSMLLLNLVASVMLFKKIYYTIYVLLMQHLVLCYVMCVVNLLLCVC